MIKVKQIKSKIACKPDQVKTLEALGAEGIGRIDVLCPGFPADCLETLEEIAMMNREVFIEAGGKEYHYIPALNDRSEHIAMLAVLVQQTAQDWLS